MSGSRIHVTMIIQMKFHVSNPFRTLHLNNIVITPHIIKNLISVCKFTHTNKYTNEFDKFGFTVKNY